MEINRNQRKAERGALAFISVGSHTQGYTGGCVRFPGEMAVDEAWELLAKGGTVHLKVHTTGFLGREAERDSVVVGLGTPSTLP